MTHPLARPLAALALALAGLAGTAVAADSVTRRGVHHGWPAPCSPIGPPRTALKQATTGSTESCIVSTQPGACCPDQARRGSLVGAGVGVGVAGGGAGGVGVDVIDAFGVQSGVGQGLDHR